MSLLDCAYFNALLPSLNIKSISDMQPGLSGAKLYRLDSVEQSFVARCSAGFYGVDGFTSEMRIYDHVAEHGFAPKVRFSVPKTFLSICDFVEDLGFFQFYQARPKQAIKKLVVLLRALHQLSDASMKPFSVHQEMERVLRDVVPSSMTAQAFDILMRAYTTPWPSDRTAFCHNDMHPKNILFDGEKITLVDWEMAGLNHPFYDLAFMSNFLFLTKKEGYEFLAAYLDDHLHRRDEDIFDNLRRFGYGFLASFHFQAIAKNDVDLSGEPYKFSLNYEDIYNAWTQAARNQDLKLHHHLGMIFLNESLKY